MKIRNLPSLSPLIKQAIEHFGTIELNSQGLIEANSITLGNIKFWVDVTGLWANELAYSIPTSQWDINALVDAMDALYNNNNHSDAAKDCEIYNG